MKKRWWITVAVILIDRVTKLAAAGMDSPAVLLEGVLGLRYAENTGAAFSLFSGFPQLLGIVSLIVVTVCLWALKPYRLGSVSGTGAAFVIGGALGNAFDRLVYGKVTDMIEILLFRFAIFNIADVFLCIGVALLAISLLFLPDEWEAKVSGKQ